MSYKSLFATKMLVIVLFVSGSLGLATASIMSPIATPAAHAGWIDRIQLTGAYLNVNGREYFLGDYNQTGSPAFQGVTWELRNNGQIIAKGYGHTPRAALWLIQKFFQPIHAS
jgi:hypothetical protein